MIKYLGVHICSASKFKLSDSEVKASFHRTVNGLLCKTKGKFDDIVICWRRISCNETTAAIRVEPLVGGGSLVGPTGQRLRVD